MTTLTTPDAPGSTLPRFAAQAPAYFAEALMARFELRPNQARRAMAALARHHLVAGMDWPQACAALPRQVREIIDQVTAGATVLHLQEVAGSGDATQKLLFRTEDGLLIESVIIPSEGGRAQGRTTLCVSSQVGCGRRCRFCETGVNGLVRQLRADEIVAQFRQARLFWEQERKDAPPLSNVVFMGMGEPLDNLEAVLAAIEVLTDDLVYGLAARRITVSTVGVADRIGPFLARSKAHLAVSLNAPDDARRSALMPVARRCDLATLKRSLVQGLQPGRDVLIEYILFAGFNDSAADALLLLAFLEGLPARVNLIPANPGPDPNLRQPEPAAVLAFQRQLLDAGARAMVRYPHGREVGGACGQLAGRRRQGGGQSV